MAEIFSSCAQCGAPFDGMDTSDEGRASQCRYCGSRARTPVDPTRIAASIRADLHEVGAFLEHLAGTLEKGFPDQTVVHRAGPLFRAKKVESLEVRLSASVFRLHRAQGNVRAEHGEAVRGIVLKHEEVPLEGWVERLCKALAAASDESVAAREALGKIVGGGRT